MKGLTPLRVLFVEDSENDALLLIEILEQEQFHVDYQRVETESQMRDALREQAWDVILCDYVLPSFDAPNAMRILKESGGDIPLIVVSGVIGEDVAVETLKLGADDYILKHNPTRLPSAIRRELREAHNRREHAEAEKARREAEEALRKSEERHRMLFEFSPVPMVVWDRETLFFLSVNDAAVRQFGYSREELKNTTVVALFPKEDQLRWQATIRNLPLDRPSQLGTTRVLKKDGALIQPEIFAQPLTFHDRPAFLVLAIDATERLQAAEKLRESQLRLERAHHIAQIGDWVYDFQTGRLEWSREVYSIFGLARQEFDGTLNGFLQRVHPADLESFRRLRDRTQRNGEILDYEHRIIRPDGEIRYVHERAEILLDTDGRPLRRMGTVQDITDRRLAELKIAEQAALLDQANDAILVQNLDGTICYWNKSAERIFGWRADNVLGEKAQDMLYRDPSACDDVIEKVRTAGVWAGEMTKRTREGREVLVEGHWTLLKDETGAPKSILIIDTDVTEKKQLEAQYFRAQRLESIGTLAGGIAHDLNNVLGPIIMALDLFKLKLTDPEDQELLDTVEGSARRGADMVRQVLSFARGVEGARLQVQPQQLVKDVERIARDTFSKTISVQTYAPADTWHVTGDATQLHQVLLNLCVNARDAMPEGGQLRLSLENEEIDAHFAAMHHEAEPGKYVVISVADTGCGMPPEVKEKIFEPFFTTKDIGKGRGLGLCTTLAIIKSHNGFITVDSKPGGGTTFRVHLPAAGAECCAAEEGPTRSLPRGRGELILVIDDEAPVRSITRQTLEAFGYKVLTAADGAEGIAAYAQNMGKISAVLTDMMMPVMDGVAAIRALMRLDPAVQIIAASGLGTKSSEATAAGDGVRHFLAKPYAAEKLLQTLDEMLHQPDVIERPVNSFAAHALTI